MSEDKDLQYKTKIPHLLGIFPNACTINATDGRFTRSPDFRHDVPSFIQVCTVARDLHNLHLDVDIADQLPTGLPSHWTVRQEIRLRIIHMSPLDENGGPPSWVSNLEGSDVDLVDSEMPAVLSRRLCSLEINAPLSLENIFHLI